MTVMTAQEVRDEVLSRSNARRKQTVMALCHVLEGLRAKGIRIFSIANVGRACEAAGVLNTQSIRNSTGKDFRAIIDTFAAEIGASTTHQAPVVQTPIEEAIASIADLDVRTRMRMMLAENKQYREELSRLKEFFKRHRLGTVPAPDATLQLPNSVRAVAVEVLVPVKSVDVDVTPLQKFLSDEYLGDLRWQVGDDGALYEGKDRLTPVGFVPALEKLITMTKRK
jgi:hypothetical protein